MIIFDTIFFIFGREVTKKYWKKVYGIREWCVKFEN